MRRERAWKPVVVSLPSLPLKTTRNAGDLARENHGSNHPRRRRFRQSLDAPPREFYSLNHVIVVIRLLWARPSYVVCQKESKSAWVIVDCGCDSMGFKPRSCMESPLWPVLYSLWADPVRTGISLGCGTGLKVPPTVGAHSGPLRGMDLERNHKRKACDYDSHIESVSIVNGEGHEGTGEAVRRMKANDKRACITREVRKELGLEFKNLPPAEKSKYVSQQHRVDKVAHDEAKFLTQCAPDRFAAAVGQLTDKQREVVCEMGLDNLIKLNCGRLKRKLCCWLVERTDVASPQPHLVLFSSVVTLIIS
ncbi:hypothetical protein WN944_012770 [Citrus x changshan-huyou]|uniref:Uncharacterized protein n=1 Tax=Citrus x changshan-huyou TaxID=2935761 RepID=A0AAP0QNE0_9ROSI